MDSWRACWAWWQLSKVLTREEIRRRYDLPGLFDDQARKCAGRYLAVTEPAMMAALVGAAALILTTAAAIYLK